MRELILDTETTGLDYRGEDRVFEIGILEVEDRLPTGKHFHKYIDPQKELSEASVRITGFTNADLVGKPLFADVVDEMLEFIGSDPIVAHNASFDMGFLNGELVRCGRPELPNEVVDTLEISRKKFPGGRHSLDALCQRFQIDLTERSLHGALLDARLLAEVYIELNGGRQTNLLAGEESVKESRKEIVVQGVAHTPRSARTFAVPPEELDAHKKFIEEIENALWLVEGESA